MDYLERNHTILQEMSSARLSKGLQVGVSLTGDGKPKTVFNCLGNYDSEFLACELYTGLKRTLRHNSDTVSARATAELAVIRHIAQFYPHLVPELPAFYGLLVGKNGESLGSITEDFSKGGLYKVEDVFTPFMIKHRERIPTELKNAFVDMELDEEDLARMCFIVNGARRIGDFYNIDLTQEAFDEIGFASLCLNPGQYTLRIDYDI